MINAPATPIDMMRPEAKLPANAAQPKNIAEIKRAAREYESVFLNEMMQHMFSGIKPNETFGGGNAEDIYRSMMVQEYANSISKNGGFGLADAIMHEMIKMQGEAK